MLFQVMLSRNLSCATAYFTLPRVPPTAWPRQLGELPDSVALVLPG
jgi:hypothetical protein